MSHNTNFCFNLLCCKTKFCAKFYLVTRSILFNQLLQPTVSITDNNGDYILD